MFISNITKVVCTTLYINTVYGVDLKAVVNSLTSQSKQTDRRTESLTGGSVDGRVEIGTDRHTEG